MKKFEVLLKRGDGKNHFFKRCPLGGICLNPMCIFGCVESNKSTTKDTEFKK